MNFPRLRCLLLVLCVPWLALGQTVNSGSNGSDGAFHPKTNMVVDMADHPDGIYHYTSVNIPAGVTVSFIPNAKNTPVTWLVQSSCVINGEVDLSGQTPQDNGGTLNLIGGAGGPGGFRGGNAGESGKLGLGPGSGSPAAYGALPTVWDGTTDVPYLESGSSIYGSQFILPLIGGSGGERFFFRYTDGRTISSGGGGGGGAMLIAAPESVELSGSISSRGGAGGFYRCGDGCYGFAGGGSGGAVRIVTRTIRKSGGIDCSGGTGPSTRMRGGRGRVRFDVFESNFGGHVVGVFTQGFQPIILPAAGQGIQLAIASVAGGSVPANPSSSLANPAVIVPAQQASSVPVVVQCFNVPLNTPITVTARPANGAAVSASGLNSSGTTTASTATVNLNLPRGSGILMAKASVAVAQGASGGLENPRSQPAGDEAADSKVRAPGGADFPVRSNAKLADLPLSVTGLTTDGERIAAVEVEATLGGGSRTVYVTESGKRIPAPTGK